MRFESDGPMGAYQAEPDREELENGLWDATLLDPPLNHNRISKPEAQPHPRKPS